MQAQAIVSLVPNNALDPSGALLDYYDSHLAQHGDTARGAAWPDEQGRALRFDVGLEIIQQASGGRPIRLVDFGCGTGELYRHIRDNGLDHINYVGVDRSAAALALAREKFPGVAFHRLNVLTCSNEELGVLDCDYIFANGVMTVKGALDHAAMWQYMTDTLKRLWSRAGGGIVFNVMSKIVDWERDDLFHVSYDELAQFLHGLAGRAIGFRADYGLYELMAYALKPAATETGLKAGDGNRSIPVNRPKLPVTDQLLPYLSTVDANRWYSNAGMLVERLMRRLSAFVNGSPDCLRLASSGTAALYGAILAKAGRARAERPLAFCAAYTFVATAAAAEQAGYQPYLVDVDPKSWTLEPAMLNNHPMLDKIGIVLVTAPYGRPVGQAGWQEFSQSTGIPVVIDAAAAFDRIAQSPAELVGEVPVVVSFHATKTFSTAEGGAVLSTDAEFLDRFHATLNFGFRGSRESQISGTNGKMSEYHAAVGLAELDGWAAKAASFNRVAETYGNLAEHYGLFGQIITGPEIGSCYALFEGKSIAEIATIEQMLREARVDYRFWYGLGLHREPYFCQAPRDSLPNTEHFAGRLIGLPVAPDLSEANISHIVRTIASGTGESRRERPGLMAR